MLIFVSCHGNSMHFKRGVDGGCAEEEVNTSEGDGISVAFGSVREDEININLSALSQARPSRQVMRWDQPGLRNIFYALSMFVFFIPPKHVVNNWWLLSYVKSTLLFSLKISIFRCSTVLITLNHRYAVWMRHRSRQRLSHVIILYANHMEVQGATYVLPPTRSLFSSCLPPVTSAVLALDAAFNAIKWAETFQDVGSFVCDRKVKSRKKGLALQREHERSQRQRRRSVMSQSVTHPWSKQKHQSFVADTVYK